MKILKFGGTSVGSPQRMKDVCQLITDGDRKIVVLSAMSGTTNSLVEIADYINKRNPEAANNVINKLRNVYLQHIEELYVKEENLLATRELLLGLFKHLHQLTTEEYSLKLEKEILAQGELMSTNMVTNYLKEQGVKVCLIPALDYMKTDDKGEPDMPFIKTYLNDFLKKNGGYDSTSRRDSSAATSWATSTTCNAVVRTTRRASSVRYSVQRKSRFGQTLTGCTTTTRASYPTRPPCASSTLRKQPNWLTLVRRFFTPPASSLPAMPVYP